jgi:hypothetical protein
MAVYKNILNGDGGNFETQPPYGIRTSGVFQEGASVTYKTEGNQSLRLFNEGIASGSPIPNGQGRYINLTTYGFKCDPPETAKFNHVKFKIGIQFQAAVNLDKWKLFAQRTYNFSSGRVELHFPYVSVEDPASDLNDNTFNSLSFKELPNWVKTMDQVPYMTNNTHFVEMEAFVNRIGNGADDFGFQLILAHNDPISSQDFADVLNNTRFFIDEVRQSGNIDAFNIQAVEKDPNNLVGDNGELDVTITGGTDEGFTWEWDDGFQTLNPTNLSAGGYWISVTDNLTGVTIRKRFILSHQPVGEITIEGDITPVSNVAENNGAIDATISGGSGNYGIVWSNGEITEDVNNLTPGDYTIIVTDLDSGNVFEQTFTVNQIFVLAIEVQISGFDVDLTVTGGTPGYVYQWSDGAQTQDRVNLAPGVYSVVVTDSIGVQATAVIELSSPKFQFSKNPVLLKIDPVADLQNKPNLSFTCTVEIAFDRFSPNIYTEIIKLEQSADSEGKTTFNVSEILHNSFENELPTLLNQIFGGGPGIWRKEDSYIRYRLKYAEKYGNPPVEQPNTTSQALIVIKGGLSDYEHAKGTFFKKLEGKKSAWLTWKNKEYSIFENQYNFVSFIMLRAYEQNISCNYTIIFTDGNEYNGSLGRDTSNPKIFEVYYLRPSVLQWELKSLFPNKDIKYFEFQIDYRGEKVSDKIKINVKKPKAPIRQFLYLNTLGAWETAAFECKSELDLSSEEETIERNLGNEYLPTDRKEKTVRKYGNQKDVINAGYFTNQEIQEFIPFFLSEEVYEIVNDEFIPVRISVSNKIKDDFERIIPVKFEVIQPPIENYTPQL